VTPPAPWLRWLGAALLVVFGAVIGLAGAFVQAHRAAVDVPWGVLQVPWGVILVWAALLAAIRAGAWAIASRWGSWAVLLGWIGATVAMSAETSSGDVALSGGGRQLAYLLVGVVAGSTAASLPLPRPSADGRSEGIA
jgi:sulfite exporter TauE/SafE